MLTRPRQAQRVADDNETVTAFIEIDDFVYSLSTKPSLIKTKSEGRILQNNWPIIRWESEYQEPEYLNRVRGYRVGNELNLWPEGSQGCLAYHPLRYSDINGDAQSELVMFLTNTLMVFSPQSGKVVFSVDLSVEDWLNEEETAEHYRSFGPHPSDGDAQFQSRISKESAANGRGWASAYRGYAKIYLDDFDDDEAHDIVAWHKLYQSRLRGDETRGFRLLRNTLIHYKLVNGEYQKQATTPAVMQGWLAARQLTWQKGYPSKSECPGQENQLIPEMHDPLLNDPDVLQ